MAPGRIMPPVPTPPDLDPRQQHQVGGRFAGVLFDLDGTLADTAADLATGVNGMLASFDLDPLPASAILEHVGRGVRVLVEECLREERGVSPDAVGGLDNAVLRFRSCYADHLLDTTRPYPGIVEMLDRLQTAGIVLGIVTNKVEDLSRRIVEGLGLSGRFRVLIGGDSLSTRKPEPEPLLYALAAMGVPVERAAMVGDSAIDIEAARSAGIAVAAVTWGFTPGPSLRKRGPDRLVDGSAQLEEWLLGGVDSTAGGSTRDGRPGS